LQQLANFHNTADTFRPYDASQAIGDTQPTTPKPPKKPKCGVFGIILLAVIAIAVAVVTTGAAVAALSGTVNGLASGISTVLGTSVFGGTVGTVGAGTLIAAGAIGGAVGSIVSQGVGVATGLQDKFSWKGVAIGGIAGGIGGAIGPGGLFGDGLFSGVKSAVVAGVLRGAVSSAATQGISVALKLQDKFSWAGVAAAGVAGGVGAFVGGKDVLNVDSLLKDQSFGNIVGTLLTGAARTVASAATRSLIEGTDFGDNVIAGLPDVVAQTVVDTLTGALAKGGGSKAKAATGDPVNLIPDSFYDPVIVPELEGFLEDDTVTYATGGEAESDEGEIVVTGTSKKEKQGMAAVNSANASLSASYRTGSVEFRDELYTQLGGQPPKRRAPSEATEKPDKKAAEDNTVDGYGSFPDVKISPDGLSTIGWLNISILEGADAKDLGGQLLRFDPELADADDATIRSYARAAIRATDGNYMMLDFAEAQFLVAKNSSGEGQLVARLYYEEIRREQLLREPTRQAGREAADAASIELVRTAIPPLDTFMSATAIARGNGTGGDILVVGAAALPGASVAVRVSVKGGTKLAARGTATAARFLSLTERFARASGPEAAALAQEIAQLSTRISTNGSKGRVVLGNWDGTAGGYVAEAERNGGFYFMTDENFYSTLLKFGDESFAASKSWEVNQAFLVQQLERGIPRFDITKEGLKKAFGSEPGAIRKEIDFLSKYAPKFGYQRVGSSWIKHD
jgi:hypothetical protein